MYYKIIVFLTLIFETVLSTRCDSQNINEFTSKSDEITNPGYPNYYGINLLCKYRIIVGSDQQIIVDFKKFSTEATHDILQIYDGYSISDPLLGSFSGSSIPPPLISSGNQLYIQFKSDSSVPGPGFKLTYHTKYSKDCDYIFNDRNGYFQSPHYPSAYPYAMSCSWIIQGPTNSFIVLSFIDFETEANHDILQVYDGSVTHDSLVANHSGSAKPTNLMSRSNIFKLKFISDMNIEKRGFNISYKIITGEYDMGMAYITTPSSLITIMPNRSTVEYFLGHFEEYKKIVPVKKKSQDLKSSFLLLSTEFQIYSSNDIIAKNVKRVEEMAYDWTHGLVFLMDFHKTALEVIDLKDNNVYHAFNVSSQSRDLNINVRNSVLIWSIIGFSPKIISSNFDGTNQSILYSNSKQAIHLTVDYQTERYYFIDIKDFSLYSIDFNGNNEKYYMTSETMFDSINSISVLNNNLYLCNKQMIYKIYEIDLSILKAEILFKSYEFDKMPRSSSWLIEQGFLETDSKVIKRNQLNYLYLAQPDFTNKCESANCSHLCLPIGQTYRCVCPSEYILNDENQCIEDIKHFNENISEVFTTNMETEYFTNTPVESQSTVEFIEDSSSTAIEVELTMTKLSTDHSLVDNTTENIIGNKSKQKEQVEFIEKLAQLQNDYLKLEHSCNINTLGIVNFILIILVITTTVFVIYFGYKRFTAMEKISYRRNDTNLLLIESENVYDKIEDTFKSPNKQMDKQDFS